MLVYIFLLSGRSRPAGGGGRGGKKGPFDLISSPPKYFRSLRKRPFPWKTFVPIRQDSLLPICFIEILRLLVRSDCQSIYTSHQWGGERHGIYHPVDCYGVVGHVGVRLSFERKRCAGSTHGSTLGVRSYIILFMSSVQCSLRNYSATSHVSQLVVMLSAGYYFKFWILTCLCCPFCQRRVGVQSFFCVQYNNSRRRLPHVNWTHDIIIVTHWQLFARCSMLCIRLVSGYGTPAFGSSTLLNDRSDTYTHTVCTPSVLTSSFTRARHVHTYPAAGLLRRVAPVRPVVPDRGSVMMGGAHWQDMAIKQENKDTTAT